MSSTVSPQWQDKASDFFSNSGVKLKEGSHYVVDAAEKVGSVVKSKWSLFQQPSTKLAMQERFISAAASTSHFLRKGFSETKDKVVVGKVKVEEVAKKTAQRSKSIISDIERWQKGVASTDVFGVPIEVTLKRQQTNTYTPDILVRCADHLISSGLNAQYLFKAEGDKKLIQQLVSLYNQEPSAALPEGTNPVDVAALIKCYLASLPEPIITYELYDEISGRRSNINLMRNILKKLPTVNYMTVEFVTALLLRVSQKSLLNKAWFSSVCSHLTPPFSFFSPAFINGCTVNFSGILFEFSSNCGNRTISHRLKIQKEPSILGRWSTTDDQTFALEGACVNLKDIHDPPLYYTSQLLQV